jgi:hypothetical protein
MASRARRRGRRRTWRRCSGGWRGCRVGDWTGASGWPSAGLPAARRGHRRGRTLARLVPPPLRSRRRGSPDVPLNQKGHHPHEASRACHRRDLDARRGHRPLVGGCPRRPYSHAVLPAAAGVHRRLEYGPIGCGRHGTSASRQWRTIRNAKPTVTGLYQTRVRRLVRRRSEPWAP